MLAFVQVLLALLWYTRNRDFQHLSEENYTLTNMQTHKHSNRESHRDRSLLDAAASGSRKEMSVDNLRCWNLGKSRHRLNFVLSPVFVFVVQWCERKAAIARKSNIYLVRVSMSTCTTVHSYESTFVRKYFRKYLRTKIDRYLGSYEGTVPSYILQRYCSTRCTSGNRILYLRTKVRKYFRTSFRTSVQYFIYNTSTTRTPYAL